MEKINYVLAFVIMLSVNTIFAQKVEVNTEKSSIEWLGTKLGGQHVGNIQLKSGSFDVKDDVIVFGNFIIDMASLTCSDLEDAGYNQKLVGHLKSDDFFGVEKYPTASFFVTKSTKFTEGKAIVTGNIIIKDKTESISFEVLKTGNEYSSKIKIDRTKFDVRYGSDSFFDNLGNKAIGDIFTLDVNLVLN